MSAPQGDPSEAGQRASRRDGATRPDDGAKSGRGSRLDAWLARLDLEALGGAEREGIVSRDLLLHGRLRPDIRITVIDDPGLGCLIWVHYAPPLADGFRKTYQRLLHWNDELPFVKFGLTDEERIALSAELPRVALDADVLGLALARLVAVCDLLAEESANWIWPHGQPRPPARPPSPIMARFAAALGELWASEPGEAPRAEVEPGQAPRAEVEPGEAS